MTNHEKQEAMRIIDEAFKNPPSRVPTPLMSYITSGPRTKQVMVNLTENEYTFLQAFKQNIYCDAHSGISDSKALVYAMHDHFEIHGVELWEFPNDETTQDE